MMLPLLNDTADSSESLKKLSRQLARGHPAQKDIELLLTVLEDPLLRTVLQIKNSLDDLKVLVQKHPSILPRDFDILRDGTLEYRCDDDNNPSTSQTTALNSAPASGYLTQQSVDGGGNVVGGERFLTVELMKVADGDLGLTVGIVNGEDGDVHFFIKQIHPDSIAQRDGRLSEGDKVVAINGNRLSGVSYRDVVLLLQEASGLVSLLVDRGQQNLLHGSGVYQTFDNLVEGHYSHQQPQTAGEFVPEMVLNTEWAQVEAIELVNDGTGLGFGIIGGRSTGVVVKTILPGGVADRDGRLLSGDHILQIGEVNLRGMGSEQVAAVLRQAGNNVRLVVARPVDASVAAGVEGLAAPVVPTRILADADEVERHLVMFSNNNNNSLEDSSVPTSTTPGTESVTVIEQPGNLTTTAAVATNAGLGLSSATLPLGHSPAQNSTSQSGKLNQEDVSHEMQKELLSLMGLDQLPEMETFEVELVKDQQGLGITIAGYVCEKGKDEEISGVFVKSIAKGSAADLSRRIRVNDQVIEVDGRPLQGYSNHQAVELLRSTGKVVKLRLARYLRGARYDQLQQAIQAESGVGAGVIASPHDFASAATNATTNLNNQSTAAIANLDNLIHGVAETEQEKIQKWQSVFGDDYIIAVAQLCKFHEGGGLGISLEGTVDVNEQGEEVRPHHYIRSILPDGPVGLNGVLRSGDELVEVNGRQLLGLDHRDVVNTLKDLPLNVEMVCARAKNSLTAMSSHAHSSKAKSDTSLNRYSSEDDEGGAFGGASGSQADICGGNGGVAGGLAKLKLRSRSLEPLSGLAMWSNEPQVIELIKAERGLGFSILDYQDPMNPNETVIVIRSLVPGGVAQQDGRLIPGDRLLFVNDVVLENASLDTAVQALKGAAKGPVRIGVAKPLPLPCPHEGNSSQQNPHPDSPTLAALVKSESF